MLVEKSIFQHVRKRVFNRCRSHGVLIVVETYLSLKLSVGTSVSPSVNSLELKAASRKGGGWERAYITVINTSLLLLDNSIENFTKF